MSSAKLAAACALAAIGLSACGSTSKPVAGSAVSTTGKRDGRGVIDDPRTKHMRCLQQNGLPVRRIVSGGSNDLPGMQIGAPGSGPTVRFEPTPGAAQFDQIKGSVQGAEVIGTALLFPNQAPDNELKVIEDCLAEGVKG